jgi:hypothetical protein
LDRRVLGEEEADKRGGVSDRIMRRANQCEDVIEYLCVCETRGDEHREAVPGQGGLFILIDRLKQLSSGLDHWEDVCVNLMAVTEGSVRVHHQAANLLANFLRSLNERNEVPMGDAVHQNGGESRARVRDRMADLMRSGRV